MPDRRAAHFVRTASEGDDAGSDNCRVSTEDMPLSPGPDFNVYIFVQNDFNRARIP